MPSPRIVARPARRRSGALSLRPAMQSNCRRCHSALSSPLSFCYLCSQGMAGVRWARLAVHTAAVLLPVACAVVAWRLR